MTVLAYAAVTGEPVTAIENVVPDVIPIARSIREVELPVVESESRLSAGLGVAVLGDLDVIS
jgi:hypothetical protein